MTHQYTSETPTEGTLRERLAAYFLTAPPLKEQTDTQRREYLSQLARLGALERQELLHHAGASRPMVWGNPAPLILALACAAQRLAAGLGQPLMVFPAKGAAVGAETLFHPRVLSMTLAALLCDLCRRGDGSPIWVRLQEQRHGLAVSVSGVREAITPETAALLKECTRLHGGSLVHCDHRILFTCGQAECPPAGVHLYVCPTEQELLEDSLSPVWSGFYGPLYASGSSSGVKVTKPSSSAAAGAGTGSAGSSEASDSAGSSG